MLTFLLLTTGGVAQAEEALPIRISIIGDKGVEAAANNTLKALRSFKATPDDDRLADLHRAGRGLNSQLNRHYSYFGPKASQKFEGNICPLLDAVTAALHAYKAMSLNEDGTGLTLQAIAECRFLISPRRIGR